MGCDCIQWDTLRIWALAGFANCVLWLGCWMALVRGAFQPHLWKCRTGQSFSRPFIRSSNQHGPVEWPGLWRGPQTVCWPSHPGFIFTKPDGTPWLSYFYQHSTFLPLPLPPPQQQADGDMLFLWPFIGSGNSIEEKFWSLHSYCWGAQRQGARRQYIIRIRCHYHQSPNLWTWPLALPPSWRSYQCPIQRMDQLIAFRLPITLQCLVKNLSSSTIILWLSGRGEYPLFFVFTSVYTKLWRRGSCAGANRSWGWVTCTS